MKIGMQSMKVLFGAAEIAAAYYVSAIVDILWLKTVAGENKLNYVALFFAITLFMAIVMITTRQDENNCANAFVAVVSVAVAIATFLCRENLETDYGRAIIVVNIFNAAIALLSIMESIDDGKKIRVGDVVIEKTTTDGDVSDVAQEVSNDCD